MAALGALLWQGDGERDTALQTLAMLALAVPAVLLPAELLRRRRRVPAPRRPPAELDSDNWREAVRQLRDERAGTPSAFDALASGMESVLGESERRWQALAELSADWYWETDRQQRLSWLSGAAPQVLAPGLDEAALLGRRFDQIALFRSPEQGWTALQARMARLEAFREVEFQVAVAGRPVQWIAISGRPRQNMQGHVIGYEGVGRDITERRLAHERLLASEQRWSTMTRLAADWYWQTDAEHRLMPFSAEQRQRVGADLAEQLEGKTRWEAHRDALTPEQWAEHRADLEAHRPFRSLQLEVEAGDGRWLWISLSGMPRMDGAGRFLGYHGVGRDITSRQQAQALHMADGRAQLVRQLAREGVQVQGQLLQVARAFVDGALQRLVVAQQQRLGLLARGDVAADAVVADKAAAAVVARHAAERDPHPAPATAVDLELQRAEGPSRFQVGAVLGPLLRRQRLAVRFPARAAFDALIQLGADALLLLGIQR